jgi:hypothetical protein
MIFVHPTERPQDPLVPLVTETATFLWLRPRATSLNCPGSPFAQTTVKLTREPTRTSMVPEPEHVTATSRVPRRISGIAGNERAPVLPPVLMNDFCASGSRGGTRAPAAVEGVAEGAAVGLPEEGVSTGASLGAARLPVDIALVHPANASRTTGTSIPVRLICAP